PTFAVDEPSWELFRSLFEAIEFKNGAREILPKLRSIRSVLTFFASNLSYLARRHLGGADVSIRTDLRPIEDGGATEVKVCAVPKDSSSGDFFMGYSIKVSSKTGKIDLSLLAGTGSPEKSGSLASRPLRIDADYERTAQAMQELFADLARDGFKSPFRMA
ncbi:MAG TPA: hypothetical protein VM598_10485, partial [Bdellovibrionota bacterium]|nr:hypothetical protein [Bdellovibrionota bacterium]